MRSPLFLHHFVGLINTNNYVRTEYFADSYNVSKVDKSTLHRMNACDARATQGYTVCWPCRSIGKSTVLQTSWYLENYTCDLCDFYTTVSGYSIRTNTYVQNFCPTFLTCARPTRVQCTECAQRVLECRYRYAMHAHFAACRCKMT